MRKLNNPQASGKVTEARPQLEDVAARIEEVLQYFDVLSSKADQYLVRYAYRYLLGAALLFTLSSIVIGTLSGFNKVFLSSFIKDATDELLIVIGACLLLWTFNGWRRQVPHILQDVFEKKRIQASAGETARHYLGFLEQYRDMLRSPRRYLLIGSLEIIVLIIYLEPIAYLAEQRANIILVIYIPYMLAMILTRLGMVYYLGVLLWTLAISGWHIRELSRRFEFYIEPVHPDHCGGLRLLGDFCFGAASPLFTIATFFIGYLSYFVILRPTFTEGPRGTITLTLTFGFIIYILLLYVFPVAVLVVFLPLWNIHTKMCRKRETAEENYVGNIAVLREEIQVLLANNRLEEAKTAKEKKELLEAECLPYPTWPFYVRTKLFSTVLKASGSFVLGTLTALLTRIVLGIILGRAT